MGGPGSGPHRRGSPFIEGTYLRRSRLPPGCPYLGPFYDWDEAAALMGLTVWGVKHLVYNAKQLGRITRRFWVRRGRIQRRVLIPYSEIERWMLTHRTHRRPTAG